MGDAGLTEMQAGMAGAGAAADELAGVGDKEQSAAAVAVVVAGVATDGGETAVGAVDAREDDDVAERRRAEGSSCGAACRQW